VTPPFTGDVTLHATSKLIIGSAEFAPAHPDKRVGTENLNPGVVVMESA
jgi:hypothetical protein